jgi:anti-sigma factor RsiW
MTDGRRRFTRDWGIDHLSQDAVVAFVDDELSTAAHERATRHVAGCAECAGEVVAQRQVRSALRGASEPHVPSSLLSKLGAIPRDTDLPTLPPGLAMSAEGELVSVLRPERVAAAVRPTRELSAFEAPAGLDARAIPGQSRRRLRVGVTAVSGLALAGLTFVALPAGDSTTAPVQPDRGVLGGPVLGTPSVSNARLDTAPVVQPAAVRPSPTTSPAPTPESGE